MPEITDFQKIAEQWANSVAARYGTRVDWVCLNGQHPDLANYPQYKLSWHVDDLGINWANQTSMNPDVLFMQHLENTGSQTPTTIVKRSEKKNDTYTTALTLGLKLGVEISYSQGASGGIGGKFTAEVNLSTTVTETHAVERTWEIDQSIPQAPHSTTDIKWLLDRKNVTGDFAANVVISGWVAVWFKDKIDFRDPNGNNKHWLWFSTAASIVRDMKPAGFTIVGNNVIFKATGVIKGDVGIESRLILKESPLKVQMLLTTDNTNTSAAISDTPIVSHEYIIAQNGEILQGDHIAAAD